MPPLPAPPTEVPRVATLDLLAPRFREAVANILMDMAAVGHKAKVFETVRTNDRQAWLYGFGRDYDDGRGPVTKAKDASGGWHFYGTAADIVEDDATPWVASQAFWQALGEAAERHGCTWGGRWKMLDLPHVQFGGCTTSPTDDTRRNYQLGGRLAVWREVGAA